MYLSRHTGGTRCESKNIEHTNEKNTSYHLAPNKNHDPNSRNVSDSYIQRPASLSHLRRDSATLLAPRAVFKDAVG